jgi:hypothetical protein
MGRPGMRALFYTPDTVLGRNLNWRNVDVNWRGGLTTG